MKEKIKYLIIAAAVSSMISACGIVVKIGSEEEESTDSQTAKDPFYDAANPAHPILRWRKEQKLTLRNAALAKIAENAHLPIQKISSGSTFSCGLNAKKEIQCWGFTTSIALGKDPEYDSTKRDNTNYFSLYAGKVTQLSVLENSTCILTSDSKLNCHGNNYWGQLGDGTTTNSFKPVAPVGMSDGVARISGINNKMCAISNEGQLKCWGYGLTKTPAKVAGAPDKVLSVSIGSGHQCLLTKDFGVQCWGSNSNGQLGNKDLTASSATSPIPVDGLSTDVVQVAVGSNHSCAVLNGGAVKCWGLNSKGQLGTSNNDNQSVPVDVTGLQSDVSTVALGGDFSCALMKTGSVKCWGLNSSGQLGDSTTDDRNSPVDVSGLSKPLLSIAAYDSYVCGVDAENSAWCWGNNFVGRLGNAPVDGVNKNSSVPVKVSGF
jgi:alpha-tubulin suppressor-like RCC1 family protein